MDRLRIVKDVRKALTGLLIASVLVAGFTIMPVKAADNGVIIPDADKGIQYVPYASVESSEADVPILDEFVFGGWYQKADDTDTFTAMRTKPADTDENVYAKFVPAYVLSVKMQVDEDTEKNGKDATDNATLRVLSAVDDTKYQEVGFDIWLGKRTAAEATPTITTVYHKLALNADGSSSITSENTFGPAADYFSALNLTNITDNSHASKIYVRPYWITFDGTKVEGMAKLVHVEDSYNDYISVPVNLLSGEDAAAGKVTLTYDASTWKFVETKGFEVGRLLTEMSHSVKVDESTNVGTIIIVGDAKTVGQNVDMDGLFANIRFEAVTEGTEPEGVLLSSSSLEFCDWAENDVVPTIWDYKY